MRFPNLKSLSHLLFVGVSVVYPSYAFKLSGVIEYLFDDFNPHAEGGHVAGDSATAIVDNPVSDAAERVQFVFEVRVSGERTFEFLKKLSRGR